MNLPLGMKVLDKHMIPVSHKPDFPADQGNIEKHKQCILTCEV